MPLWYRLLDQVLLVAGLLSSMVGSRTLRFGGWIGICVLILYVIVGSIPSLDHPAFDLAGEQRPELWISKLAIWLAVPLSLAICFKKLDVKSR